MVFDPPQNLCLIWDNRAFDAATLIPSDEVATLPARNLQDPQRTRPWRTTGIINRSLKIVSSEPLGATCLGMLNHNLTVEATVTIQASNDPDFGSANLLKGNAPEDTVNVWQPIIGAGELGAGESLAGGYPTEALRTLLAPRIISLNYFRPLPQDNIIEPLYWRLLFDDPKNPDGYFQIGRIFLCRFDEYVKQFGFGLELDGADDTIISKTPGGQSYHIKRPLQEIRRTPWNTFRREDLYWKFMFFRSKVGLSERFILDMMPQGNPADRFFNLLYCTLNAIPKPVGDDPGYFKLQMEFIESL